MEETFELGLIYREYKGKIDEILENAINDWPTNINSHKEYDEALLDFIGTTITKTTIIEKLNKISVLKYPWESESLFQLCEIYDFFNEKISLSDILIIIEEQNLER